MVIGFGTFVFYLSVHIKHPVFLIMHIKSLVFFLAYTYVHLVHLKFFMFTRENIAWKAVLLYLNIFFSIFVLKYYDFWKKLIFLGTQSLICIPSQFDVSILFYLFYFFLGAPGHMVWGVFYGAPSAYGLFMCNR